MSLAIAPRGVVAVLLGTSLALLAAALLVGCGAPPLPDLSGKNAAGGAEALYDAEFEGRFTWQESGEPSGAIISQDPAPGEPDPADRVVSVMVSSGRPFSPEDALGSEWQANVPAGQSDTPSDDGGSSKCSSGRQVDSTDVTSEGLTDDAYTSSSGVSGGSLLVAVRLISVGGIASAQSLLADERAAQSACAQNAGGSDYSSGPDGGVLSTTTEYSSASVGGYPALRTFLFMAAASPTLGSGVATTSMFRVLWQQGAYVVDVYWAEVFGLPLPPREAGVPSALEAIVNDVRASVGSELARSRRNTRALGAAKKALRDVQLRHGTKAGSAGASSMNEKSHSDWTSYRGPLTPATTTGTTGTDGTTTTDVGGVVPEDVPPVANKAAYTVAVLNASGVSGAAANRVAPRVQAAGYTLGVVDNATKQDLAVSHVEYVAGRQEVAWNLAKDLGITTAVPAGTLAEGRIGTADVAVIVGTDLAK